MYNFNEKEAGKKIQKHTFTRLINDDGTTFNKISFESNVGTIMSCRSGVSSSKFQYLGAI